MILLIDLCFRNGSLGFDEFVRPVARIVHHLGNDAISVHFRSVTDHFLSQAEAVILCGTPLADTAFLAETGAFSWLKKTRLPVLGICAGMEAICTIFGGTIRPCIEIGMTEVTVIGNDPIFQESGSFSAYELHTLACNNLRDLEVLAVSNQCIQVVRHQGKKIYGVMFHPEVRNEWVIERFVTLSGEEGISQ
ncbi:MAG: Anthranilate synthase component 2 [Euryarchaeota archaeon ADurb.BinA087]|mgnify:FL=1|nr:MAG: Anthranilate synthase component 2 [Euryarchaeota archaeon ADurb.BinA087]